MKKLLVLLGVIFILVLFLTSAAYAQCPPFSPCFQVYLPYTHVILQPLIPTATTASNLPTATSTSIPPTATQKPPSSVVILNNYYSYTDTLGFLHILGEIQNNTSNNVMYVEVNANLYNTNGNLLATENGFGNKTALLTTEKTCFDVLFINPPAEWASFKFENPDYLLGGAATNDVTLFDISGKYLPTYGWYEIIGQAINNGSIGHQYVEIIATLYNNENKVIGCDSGFANSDELAPGQVSAFDILSVGRDYSDVNDYRLQVDY